MRIQYFIPVDVRTVKLHQSNYTATKIFLKSAFHTKFCFRLTERTDDLSIERDPVLSYTDHQA